MSIQNKIVVGIASFVGTMLLVGWIIINEPARMEVFTQQWEGRSIERGAELYLNNCYSCHAEDGLGLAGYAPALKNPMLFLDENPGKVANDQLRALRAERDRLVRAVETYQADIVERAELLARRDAAPEGSEERRRIQMQLDEVDTRIRLFDPTTPQKIDELLPRIAEQEAKVEELRAQGWELNREPRLKELNWTGGLEAYLRSTLIAGRPTSGQLWNGNIMQAWGQEAGGPLRPDEIENLVAFIINYREEALKLTPNDIRQGFKIAGEGTVAADKEVLGAGVDIMALDLSGGDVTAGQQKYASFGCAACHSAPGGAAYNFAPTAGTYARVQNVRLRLDQFSGYTAEQYLAESILYPSRYIVPGGEAVQMPANYADQMDLQDLRDIIAYISTYR
jgi:mono/diheme cytochrome c family protein